MPIDIDKKSLTRSIELSRDVISQDDRTVELAFSSETPVERWFGNEILDHGTGSIRLGRMQNGGAVLMDHNHRDHIGVVESVSVDSDRRGRAKVRFSRNQRADEIFQDVVDGIRRHISVGYRIHKAVLEETGDDGPDTYRITDWEPYELSFVSVPADDTVGVGRHADFDIRSFIQEEKVMPTEEQTPAPENKRHEQVDVKAIETNARTAELERIRTISKTASAYGDRVDGIKDLERQFIDNGRSVAEFNSALLEKMGERTSEPAPTADKLDLELNDQEQRQFSIIRAMNAVATGDWEKAGLEREVSRTIAKQLGRDTDGVFVPTSLRMQRDVMEVGTTTTGGHTVQTEVQDIISLLRNRMMVRQMGAQVLSGLTGNLSFPRQDSANSLSWVGENPGSDVSDTNLTFDQVSMSPKTAQASTAYSRQLLVQSSADIENFVRNDLATINALGIDLAAINGSGSNNQPRGILNTTGIGSVVGGTNGAAPDWADIVQLETEVAVDNADVGNLAYLTNAKVRGKLKVTEKASGTAQYIWGDSGEAGMGMMNGYRAGVSNQVPGNLTKGTADSICSAIIFGNWADLMIGEWGAMELLVDPYRLKKQGLIEITSFILVDMALRHPESFAAMKDALTS